LFYEELDPLLKGLFQSCAQIVLIMAAGIAVRMIAPHLGNRWEDPVVVVLDDGGRNVISLLSGQWGGANALAGDIARVLGANAVITTESDVMGFPALDMLICHVTGLDVPDDPALLKRIQSAVLDGLPVGLYPCDLETACNMQGHAHLHFYDSIDELARSGCVAALVVSPQLPVPIEGDAAWVHPRNLVVGIGCHRGTAAVDIDREVKRVFAEYNLALQSIAAICTVEHKQDEGGLIAYAAGLGVPLECFAAADINKIAPLPDETKASRELPGLQEFAEAAALLGSSGGTLLASNVQHESITIAVAARPVRQILKDSGADSDVC
jgi:cobalamin biosynthesis protein CbiG